VIHSRRLPLDCDVDRLHADLDAVEPAPWHPHFNSGYYSGDWSGIPLRAQPGIHVPLYTDPTRDDFTDTEAMGRCSYVPELLARIPGTLQAVRLLRLGSGSRIREHRDPGLCIEEDVFRLHIPVRTSPDVEFVVGGQSLRMAEGECWYVNFDLPHALVNKGADRIHLVIDGIADADVLAWFDDAGPSDEAIASPGVVPRVRH
jgi:hypothetical protein